MRVNVKKPRCKVTVSVKGSRDGELHNKVCNHVYARHSEGVCWSCVERVSGGAAHKLVERR